jgi:hypothetical protein
MNQNYKGTFAYGLSNLPSPKRKLQSPNPLPKTKTLEIQ